MDTNKEIGLPGRCGPQGRENGIARHAGLGEINSKPKASVRRREMVLQHAVCAD